MPDGVKLATDIDLPGDRGSWPVFLIRTPYGRESFDELATQITSVNIAFVIQDTRGRFDSEGEHGVFFNEKTDGQATLDWITEQTWSNGRIATWGQSALGISQYLMAPGASDALVCQWIEVATPDFYADAVYQGGAYRAKLADFLLETFEGNDLADDWRLNHMNTAYWNPVQITDDYRDIRSPAVHIGGWYDIFARGTVDAFLGYQNQGGKGALGKQHLIMGPWSHTTLNSSAPTSQIAFPNGVSPDYNVWFVTWLQACLLDGPGLADMNDLAALPAVRYFTMGAVGEAEAPGNEWRTADTWPPPGGVETPLYLSSDNALSFDESQTDGRDTFRYDPDNPSPTIGGNNLNIENGPYDQRPIEQRDDVTVYSTKPLDRQIEATGDIRAEIWIMTDAPDTDIVVRLTDVYPDGRSMLIADGILRARFHDSPDFTSEELLEPGTPYLLDIDLGTASVIFNAGHRIRISITSSNVPRFAPNPNTGEMFLEEGETGQIATTTILRGPDFPSAIILPVMEERG